MNMPPRGIRPGTLVADETRLYGVLGDEMISFDLRKGDKTSARLDLTVPQADGGEAAAGGNTGAAVVVGPAGVAVGGGMRMTSSIRGGMVRWTAAGGTLYVGGNDGLFAFDGKTGQRLWVLPVKQTMPGDPVVADGVLYYTTARYGGPATDEKALPKDLPGLHAVKLGAMSATSAPAAAPAKSELPPAAVPPAVRPIKRIDGPLPPVMVTD
jgi:outer membrane protein assembly factor BamB